jgi:leucyl aminopeptidase
MKLAVTTSPVSDLATDVLGIIAFEDDQRDGNGITSSILAPGLNDMLREAFTDERFKGKIGQSVIIHTQGKAPARRLGVFGAGPFATFQPADARHPAAALARFAAGAGARSIAIAVPNILADTNQLRWLEAIAEGLLLGAYRFDKYLGPAKRTPTTLETALMQTSPNTSPQAAEAAVDRGARVAKAIARARDLVNEPAGALTPTALAQAAVLGASDLGLSVTVLGPEECRARGMGLFLAVAQGSKEEPRFIHAAWKPAGAKTRVVMVGKGVTFDSGGLSLKTTEGMLGMKSDMAGAAAVLSALEVAAEENLSVEAHALCACTENMPSGAAYKLGDVLRSMSGKTVEINNTDAEGRLTMADALTYGLALAPDVILDFATLTGACVVALGPHTAGVMTNDDAAAARWLAAARAAGEDMWPLPLPVRLVDQLKSEIADLRNTGERWGGALTAGLFLKEFVGATPWVHVDLAGPATTDKEWGCYGKGATGFGVASIVDYLRNLAHA